MNLKSGFGFAENDLQEQRTAVLEQWIFD